MSEESKEKMRQAKLKNPTRYWLGKKLSPTHNKKIQDGLKRFIAKNGHPGKGKKLPESMKKRISATLRKKYAQGEIISPFKAKWENGEFGKGSKSPAYIDGRSKEGQSLRTSPEYKEWRLKVLRLDGFACRLCGHKSTNLEVDHYPRSFARLYRENKLDLLWDTRNGRTLCKDCHAQFGERSSRDFRGAFIAALIDAARIDKRICLFVNDVGFSKIEKFQEEFPDRFYNLGVTETSTSGMLAAMALSGLKPVHYTMLTFNIFRPYEYVRNTICHQNAPVILAGIRGSQHYSMLGIGHNPVPEDEDIKVLSHLPNIKIFQPKTAEETEQAVRDAIKYNGPSYIRL